MTIIGPSIYEQLSKNYFHSKGHQVTRHLTSLQRSHVLIINLTFKSNLMIIGPSICKLLSKTYFFIKGHCDLDLWPTDLNIISGHLLVMEKLCMKFKDSRPKSSKVIKWWKAWGCFTLKVNVTLTFDLLTWIIRGAIYL